MPRVIWTPNALQDISRLHGFLKSKNPDAAKRAVRAIRQGVRLLAIHPEAGRPAQEMAGDFREWVIEYGGSGHVALYRYEVVVSILAVRHTKEGGYT